VQHLNPSDVLALLQEQERPSRKRNKYGVSRVADRTYNGVVYASKFEMEYAQHLDLMVRAGKILCWDRQANFTLKVHGQHICDFVVDFKVYKSDGGHGYYVETKGAETPVYKLKLKLFRALYPEVDLRIVKQK